MLLITHLKTSLQCACMPAFSDNGSGNSVMQANSIMIVSIDAIDAVKIPHTLEQD